MHLQEVLNVDAIQEKYRVLDEGESSLDIARDREECLVAATKLSDAKNLSLQSGACHFSHLSL